jgi:adenylate cyclase
LVNSFLTKEMLKQKIPINKKNLIKRRFYHFYVANEVVIGNALALLFGNWMANVFFMNRAAASPEQVLVLAHYIDLSYGTLCALVMSALTIWYERPVRDCLRAFHLGRTPGEKRLEWARRRVLNEPFFIVIMDAVAWALGTMMFWMIGSPGGIRVGFGSGLIAVTIAFFWVEHVSQHTRIPLFFPKGDLSKVTGVKSISLQVRFAALIFSVSLVPLAFVHLTIHRFRNLHLADAMTLPSLVTQLEDTLMVESAIFMGIAIVLSLLVLHHVRRPVAEIIRVMAHVKQGDFSQTAGVCTNDEIGFAGEMLNAMNRGLRERELIKDTFGKYVDRRIRDEILSGRVSLDGERKEATILFADLREFTPLVAVTPAKDLIYMLNAYFSEVSKAIEENGGLILQFIGDEVEAVFGAPVPSKDHVNDAVKTALDMRRRLEGLNRGFEARGLPRVAHGVGIHTGPVLAATIGSASRSTYSLIGDTVNLASRIQDLTRDFDTDILISQAAALALEGRYTFTQMQETLVKGKSDPVRVYALAETG